MDAGVSIRRCPISPTRARSKLKGGLFLFTGLLAGGLLLAEAPGWKPALLLAICVWSFCRLYYFAFYVIERYVDPGFKFAGLGSFVRYWLRRK